MSEWQILHHLVAVIPGSKCIKFRLIGPRIVELCIEMLGKLFSAVTQFSPSVQGPNVGSWSQKMDSAANVDLGTKKWSQQPKSGPSNQGGLYVEVIPPLNTVMRVASWVSPHHVASVGFYGFNPEHNRLVNEQTNCNILKLNFTVYRDPKSVCQSVPVYLCCILS